MLNPITKWLAIGGAVLVLSLGTALTIQTLRLDVEKKNVELANKDKQTALDAFARSESARKELAQYNDELETVRGEALTAQILREKQYADQIQQLLDAERDGKAVPLSTAGREYFERVRREQADRADGAGSR